MRNVGVRQKIVMFLKATYLIQRTTRLCKWQIAKLNLEDDESHAVAEPQGIQVKIFSLSRLSTGRFLSVRFQVMVIVLETQKASGVGIQG